MRIAFSILILLSAGCTQFAQQETLQDLRQELESMQAAIDTNHDQMAKLNARAQSETTAAAALDEQLVQLDESIGELGETIRAQCANQTPPDRPECEPTAPPVVMASDDKMVLGEIERVWIDPPGISVEARIDTGASSSSLHGSNITRFERDGDDWVRFDIGDEEQSTTLERPVTKFVRVYQQADRSGSRRPVVELRLYLGNVKDTFEFTLADRSHLQQEVILGRNFLTDIALVDVGRKFVQPDSQPDEQ